MKKFLAVILSAITVSLMCGCSEMNNNVLDGNLHSDINTQGTVYNGKADSDDLLTEEAYTEEHFISRSADYIATDFYDICNGADLVIRVKCVKDIDTYVSGGMLPVTKAEFDVVDVIKGEYDDDSIIIDYYGGTVSMYEYLQAMPEAEKLKGGYDYTDEEAKKTAVTYLDIDNGVSFETGTEYVVCLGYNEVDGSYMVHSDAFGISEVTGEQIYNKGGKAYIDIKDITE